jgi:hypothetical protein
MFRSRAKGLTLFSHEYAFSFCLFLFHKFHKRTQSDELLSARVIIKATASGIIATNEFGMGVHSKLEPVPVVGLSVLVML